MLMFAKLLPKVYSEKQAFTGYFLAQLIEPKKIF